VTPSSARTLSALPIRDRTQTSQFNAGQYQPSANHHSPSQGQPVNHNAGQGKNINQSQGQPNNHNLGQGQPINHNPGQGQPIDHNPGQDQPINHNLGQGQPIYQNLGQHSQHQSVRSAPLAGSTSGSNNGRGNSNNSGQRPGQSLPVDNNSRDYHLQSPPSVTTIHQNVHNQPHIKYGTPHSISSPQQSMQPRGPSHTTHRASWNQGPVLTHYVEAKDQNTNSGLGHPKGFNAQDSSRPQTIQIVPPLDLRSTKASEENQFIKKLDGTGDLEAEKTGGLWDEECGLWGVLNRSERSAEGENRRLLASDTRPKIENQGGARNIELERFQDVYEYNRNGRTEYSNRGGQNLAEGNGGLTERSQRFNCGNIDGGRLDNDAVQSASTVLSTEPSSTMFFPDDCLSNLPPEVPPKSWMSTIDDSIDPMVAAGIGRITQRVEDKADKLERGNDLMNNGRAGLESLTERLQRMKIQTELDRQTHDPRKKEAERPLKLQPSPLQRNLVDIWEISNPSAQAAHGYNPGAPRSADTESTYRASDQARRILDRVIESNPNVR